VFDILKITVRVVEHRLVSRRTCRAQKDLSGLWRGLP